MKLLNLIKTVSITTAFILISTGAFADEYTEGYDSAFVGNYSEAYTKWYPLAVDGDARAQFNLALMYHGGLHVKMDEPLALFWYKKAADNGIREAQEYMAVGYSEGWFGLPRDQKKSLYWEQKLAVISY